MQTRQLSRNAIARIFATRSFIAVALAAFFLCSTATAQNMPAKMSVSDEVASYINWRSIGPASMSGRITALAVYEKDPNIWWAASASGGLLKTTNNGVTFEHQFDTEATVSIGDVQVCQSNPDILWVGTGEGNPRNSVSWGDGVYKSVDGGATWTNMGLKETFQTGALAIHPENPDVVYVGALGRLWGPNMERGLFKTEDGGESWKKILYINAETGVTDVQLNPSNPDEVLVATYQRKRDGFDGNDPEVKYGDGAGIYKSTDAGVSFSRLNNGLPTCKMGRIGFDYYRADPNFIVAIIESEKIATEPEDQPYAGFSAEDADVGARVTSVTEGGPCEKAGLKEGDIIVAISENIVHSYGDLISEMRKQRAGDDIKIVVSREREELSLDVTLARRPQQRRRGGRNDFTGTLGGQAANRQDEQGPLGFEYGGVYLSENGGATWQRINSLNPRPMYYSHIRFDPSDRKNIYVCGTSLYKSSDGGETFTGNGGSDGIHVDHHALWIDPQDGRHMILGNDGGVFITHDRMEHWNNLNKFAIGQFYHVGVDATMNYNVYGGLQDNGSWGGPSRSASGQGAVNSDWFRVGGGDGFITMVDPDDKDQIYFESQNGGMGRINLRTGERGFIRPRPPRGSRTRYRFNWKAPFVLSPHNSKVYYSAGNHVFQSFNKGQGIKAISPEITNTNRGAGSAISESPREPGLIYVGTTDGAVWMTRDGGQNWTEIFVQREEEESEEESSDESSEEKKDDDADEEKDDPKESSGGADSEEPKDDESAEEMKEKNPDESPADAGSMQGSWTGRMLDDRIPEDRAEFAFNIKSIDGEKITGEIQSFRGEMQEFTGTLKESGDIEWVLETPRGERVYSGKLKDGKISGTMSAGGGRFEVEFEAEKDKQSVGANAMIPDSTLSITSALFYTGTDDPVSGTWEGVLDAEEVGGRVEFTIEIEMKEDKTVSGTISSPMGELDFSGEYDEEKKNVEFRAVDEENGTEIEFSGQVAAGKWTGEVVPRGTDFTFEFEAIRKGTAANEDSNEADSADSAEEPEQEKEQDSGQEKEEGSSAADDDETTQDDDGVSGQWDGMMVSPRGESELTLMLKQSDGKITGTYETQRGEGEISEGTYDAEKKRLVLVAENENFTIDFVGNVKDGSYSGEMEINGGNFTMDFEVTRKSTGSSSSTTQEEESADAESDDQDAADSSAKGSLESLVPGPRWVSSLEASRHATGRVYISLDGHRSNDDAPYAFMSDDFGKTWRSVVSSLPETAGSVRVIREDIENENLLFLGCEFSAWFSLDRGQTWNRFNGLPTVAVHEFAVHPLAGEIVAATHGRSLWVADIRMLRNMTADMMKEDFNLFPVADVIRWRRSASRGSTGTHEFRGEDPESGATIAFSLKENARSVSLEVTRWDGRTVKQFDDVPRTAGVHQIRWDLRQSAPAGRQGRNPRQGRGGASVGNGTYVVTLTVDGEDRSQKLEIKRDPESPSDAVEQNDLLFELWTESSEESDGPVFDEFSDH